MSEPLTREQLEYEVAKDLMGECARPVSVASHVGDRLWPTIDALQQENARIQKTRFDIVVDSPELEKECDTLRAHILDIDAHATPVGEDEDGFVTGGYLISVGALHRALGKVGHSAPSCEAEKERDELRAQLDVNSNHYDRYWDNPERRDAEWRRATREKMQDALTDVFCHEAADIMLGLLDDIGATEKERDELRAEVAHLNRELGYAQEQAAMGQAEWRKSHEKKRIDDYRKRMSGLRAENERLQSAWADENRERLNAEDERDDLRAENERLRAHPDLMEMLQRTRDLVDAKQELEKYRALVGKLADLVSVQAEDEGLWLIDQYASAVYLQQELRTLHAAVEDGARALLDGDK